MKGTSCLIAQLTRKLASARERFEVFRLFGARRLGGALGSTKAAYERQNAKRIYYLSMEFLLGRSLANNI